MEKSSSSESSKNNKKGDIGLIMEAESLSRTITVQTNLIQEISPSQVNTPVDNIWLDLLS